MRGLHLNQAGIYADELVSASVYDVARIALGIDKTKLKHNLSFYIPKSESDDEAISWRDLFEAVEKKLTACLNLSKKLTIHFSAQTKFITPTAKTELIGLRLS